MGLALHLGKQDRELSDEMTEAEFSEWDRYDRQVGMPWRRIEDQLARIAMFLDLGLLGKKSARLSEYRPSFDQVAANDEALIDAIEEPFSGGVVIKRGE